MRPGGARRGAALRRRVGTGQVRAWVLLAVLILLLGGCATQAPAPVVGWDDKGPVPEGYYRVKSGDTLSEVAVRLKVDTAKLARWNGLKAPFKIVSGKLLRVVPPGAGGAPAQGQVAVSSPGPAGDKPGSGSEAQADPAAKPEPREVRPGASAEAGGLTWQWPLKGPVRQTFVRGDRTRSGIRIGGRSGEQVVAAETGSVVYSGSGLKGYGNLIIVKHSKDYLSAYGYNRRLLVREGDQVKRGQPVAEVGQAAGGGWLLHFEIRRKGTAVDPLAYLPRSR